MKNVKSICLLCCVLAVLFLAACGNRDPITVQPDGTTAQGQWSEVSAADASATAEATAPTSATASTQATAANRTATANRTSAATTSRTTKSTTTTRTTTTSTTTQTTATEDSTSTTLMTDKTRRNDFTMRVVGPLTVKVGETIQLTIEADDASADLDDLYLRWGADTLGCTKLIYSGQERSTYSGDTATYIGKTPGTSYCGASYLDASGASVAYVSFTIIVTE